MPLLGSFCLLFALALAGYCLIAGIVAAVRKDAIGYRLAETARRAGMASFVSVACAAGALVFAAMTNAPAAQDRKSTRLNSSHGYISYAVFCLKKKKRKSSTSHHVYKRRRHTHRRR